LAASGQRTHKCVLYAKRGLANAGQKPGIGLTANIVVNMEEMALKRAEMWRILGPLEGPIALTGTLPVPGSGPEGLYGGNCALRAPEQKLGNLRVATQKVSSNGVVFRVIFGVDCIRWCMSNYCDRWCSNAT